LSIRTFVETASDLHVAGKYDVALALACAACDATAAKLYPDEKQNNKRYKDFLIKTMPVITRFGFPGILASSIRIKCFDVPDLKQDTEGYVGIEDIIYGTLRCGLLHQCEIDSRIIFTENTEIGDFTTKFRIPRQLIVGLLEAVRQEPCNATEFSNALNG
jgi:hypothetical protein